MKSRIAAAFGLACLALVSLHAASRSPRPLRMDELSLITGGLETCYKDSPKTCFVDGFNECPIPKPAGGCPNAGQYRQTEEYPKVLKSTIHEGDDWYDDLIESDGVVCYLIYACGPETVGDLEICVQVGEGEEFPAEPARPKQSTSAGGDCNEVG